MPAQWTGDVVAKMHINRISIKTLAEYLGVSREYTGAVLNGKKTPAGAEQRFNEAVDKLIALQSTTKQVP